MKKVLICILVVLLLVGAAAGGFWWYRNTHVFVEDSAYTKNSEYLDLRGTGISLDHYVSLQSQLPGCEILWDVPFQGKTYANDTAELTITGISEEDMLMLEYFPKLQKIDATGCQDYPALEALQAKFPDCAVIYQVDIGGSRYDPNVTALELTNGEYDLETLMANLQHLSQVESIAFPKTELTLEQIQQLQSEHEELAVSYTVEIMGQEYGPETTELNLSALVPEEIDAVGQKLAMLPALANVELMDTDGNSSLSMEDVKKLDDAAPQVVYHYAFELYGYQLSTTDESVHIKNKRIGDDGVEEVRKALDIMENCSRFVLEYCSISNDVMAQLREDYRHKTKVVWRVYFGGGSTMTDAEVIRSTYDLDDDNCGNLIYCEDVRYMDIGHNEYLDAVPFVAGMPNLEVIIVSGAPIKDLTPFENCKKLRVLEIAFCHYIEDISPLAACESLEMVNIAYTQVTDLSPLDGLNITHLAAQHSKLSDEEKARFAEVKPDCLATYENNPYGPGWRYDDENKFLDWYAEIRTIFRYDRDPNIPNNVGWYLD